METINQNTEFNQLEYFVFQTILDKHFLKLVLNDFLPLYINKTKN